LGAAADATAATSTPENQKHYIVEHTIALPTLVHFQYFWERAELRALGTEVFEDTKEITESVAAYRAALTAIRNASSSSSSSSSGGSTAAAAAAAAAAAEPAAAVLARALVVVVADGGTPRTAALFVAGTAATRVHSIDPEMRREWCLGAGGSGSSSGSGSTGADAPVPGPVPAPAAAAAVAEPSPAARGKGKAPRPTPGLMLPGGPGGGGGGGGVRAGGGAAARLRCHRAKVEDWLVAGGLTADGATAAEDAAFALGVAGGVAGGVGAAEAAAAAADAPLLVVVAVHSHVKLDAYVPALRRRLGGPRTLVVAMPCCVDQSMTLDHGIDPVHAAPAVPAVPAVLGLGDGLGHAAVPVVPAPVVATGGVVAGVPATVATGEALARKRGGGTARWGRKRKLAVPVADYEDYGVHSNERTVRVFDLPADAPPPPPAAAAACGMKVLQ
jgi:hypothetical protein